ncbi:hypothetical protein KIL84_020740 [Mauremys mutica]|uniref:Uncharacterized protein n=1 Tax=Mauremys mutica TaxID=74926 RepID=A0A9D3XAI4_9SAUR|nr:hypothetical protein KIL84_020740 [Mauremys mutica]
MEKKLPTPCPPARKTNEITHTPPMEPKASFSCHTSASQRSGYLTKGEAPGSPSLPELQPRAKGKLSAVKTVKLNSIVNASQSLGQHSSPLPAALAKPILTTQNLNDHLLSQVVAKLPSSLAAPSELGLA